MVGNPPYTNCYFCSQMKIQKTAETRAKTGYYNCRSRLQPALPNGKYDSTSSDVDQLELLICKHYTEEEYEGGSNPIIPFLRLPASEVKARIARAAVMGTLSPDYVPPWGLRKRKPK